MDRWRAEIRCEVVLLRVFFIVNTPVVILFVSRLFICMCAPRLCSRAPLLCSPIENSDRCGPCFCVFHQAGNPKNVWYSWRHQMTKEYSVSERTVLDTEHDVASWWSVMYVFQCHVFSTCSSWTTLSELSHVCIRWLDWVSDTSYMLHGVVAALLHGHHSVTRATPGQSTFKDAHLLTRSERLQMYTLLDSTSNGHAAEVLSVLSQEEHSPGTRDIQN